MDDATFEHVRRRHTVAVATFRRDGTAVSTAVSLAVDPDDPTVGWMRTWSTAGKARRLLRDPRVTVAPATIRGRVTGDAIEATATLVDGAREARARRLLARKHPVLHGVLVPLGHRLRQMRTQHYMVRAGR